MKESYLLRLPEGKLSRLKKLADSLGCSLNQLVNNLINQFIENSASESTDIKMVTTILNSSIGKDIEALIIFGSVAKNTSTDSSDLDLLIVLSESIEIKRYLYALWDNEIEPNLTLEMTNGKELSPHFVNLKTNLSDIHGLWLEVAISGKIIWMKNLNTDRLLNKIRLAISQNKFTRKESHGQPYWLRN